MFMLPKLWYIIFIYSVSLTEANLTRNTIQLNNNLILISILMLILVYSSNSNWDIDGKQIKLEYWCHIVTSFSDDIWSGHLVTSFVDVICWRLPNIVVEGTNVLEVLLCIQRWIIFPRSSMTYRWLQIFISTIIFVRIFNHTSVSHPS